MKVEDPILFLSYALPSLVGKAGCPGSCSGALINFSESQIDDFVKQVSESRVPNIDLEKTFRVAYKMCTLIATEMGKNEIDGEVIREYFLFRHNNVVDQRVELGEKFDAVACKTYAGKIMSVSGRLATVETGIDRKERKTEKYRTEFIKDAKAGDLVAVHFNFITERIPAETERKINKLPNANKKLKAGV